MTKFVSEEDFENIYKPINAPGSDENLVWEYEQTVDQPLDRVWSLVDGDLSDRQYALPGYHVVNAWGYTVTELPWEDEDIEAVFSEGPDGE